jgi:hypothetical protein
MLIGHVFTTVLGTDPNDDLRSGRRNAAPQLEQFENTTTNSRRFGKRHRLVIQRQIWI